MAAGAEIDDLRREVEQHEWYHTLELAPGLVTPGWFDTRPLVERLPLPDSLAGARCLDIGTFDGFWAFELERRGAEEVVAIDLNDPDRWDWPPGSSAELRAELAERKRGGRGFRLARRALGSEVRLEERSVYDLDPGEDGQFDFVYLGSLLLHLRDPVGALARVRSVCRGQLLVVDTIDPLMSVLFPRRPLAALDGRGRPWWWQSNVACLARMVESAGFSLSGPPRRLRVQPGRGQSPPALRPAALRTREGRREVLNARFGDPHAALLATPA